MGVGVGAGVGSHVSVGARLGGAEGGNEAVGSKMGERLGGSVGALVGPSLGAGDGLNTGENVGQRVKSQHEEHAPGLDPQRLASAEQPPAAGPPVHAYGTAAEHPEAIPSHSSRKQPRSSGGTPQARVGDPVGAGKGVIESGLVGEKEGPSVVSDDVLWLPSNKTSKL
jgi:hypothetical protein